MDDEKIEVRAGFHSIKEFMDKWGAQVHDPAQRPSIEVLTEMTRDFEQRFGLVLPAGVVLTGVVTVDPDQGLQYGDGPFDMSVSFACAAGFDRGVAIPSTAVDYTGKVSHGDR